MNALLLKSYTKARDVEESLSMSCGTVEYAAWEELSVGERDLGRVQRKRALGLGNYFAFGLK